MGGNKARKAEFLLADALQKGCDVILTAGAMQSNHARIIATASRKLSKECHLFLAGQKPDPPTANVLLDLLADAHIHLSGVKRTPACHGSFCEGTEKRMDATPTSYPSADQTKLALKATYRDLKSLTDNCATCLRNPPSSCFVHRAGALTLASW